MSRTRHHRIQKSAHLGHDLWSRRAGMAGRAYCSFNKWRTRRKERREAKIDIEKKLNENESEGI